MLILIHHELHVDIIPACEGARGLANIFLRVVSGAHGEQLHDFAREIFVRGALDVDAGVQKRKHRGILRRRHGQIPEIPGALLLKQLQLDEQLPVVPHFSFVRSEMPVPEQRHLFLQGPRTCQHPVRPPVADAVRLQDTCAQPIEKLIHNRLQTAIAAGFDLDPQSLAFLLCEVGHCRSAGRKRFKSRIVNPGMIERSETARIGSRKANESGNRLCRSHLRQHFDFLRSAAEAGPFQQMRRKFVIPVRGADRRQIVLPRGRSRCYGHKSLTRY